MTSLRRLERSRVFVRLVRGLTQPQYLVSDCRVADAALRPPVHGVPVSLKDMLEVEGYDTTIGFTYKRHQPAPKDAPLVSLIRQVRRSFCTSLLFRSQFAH